MTARSATVLVLFDGTITSANVIPFPFEIIRMTGGAEAHIRGDGMIAWNVLTIVRVTRNTPNARIVVARVVYSCMAEFVGRCPALRDMTGVALCQGVEMTLCTCWWLTGRVSTVVTVRASTSATAIVSPAATHEGCGGMTG